MKHFNKLLLIILLCAAVLGLPSVAEAAISDELDYLYNCEIVPSFDNKTDRPNIADCTDKSEIVDEGSGSLIRRETDLTLPGRDGMDLVIGRNFNSSLAEPFQKATFQYKQRTTAYVYILTVVKNGVTYTQYALNDAGRDFYSDYMFLKYAQWPTITEENGTADIYHIYDGLKSVNTNTDRFALGAGWSWNFPYLEKCFQANVGTQWFYHDSNGSTYRAMGSSLNGYPYSGYAFGQYTGEPNAAYRFIDTMKNENIFDADGKLIKMRDRFGNEISFGYNANNRLSTITDTVGRTVTFTYDNSHNNDGLSYIDMTVTDPSQSSSVTYYFGREVKSYTGYHHDTNGTSVYHITLTENNQLLLNKVINPVGGQVEYGYEEEVNYFTFNQYTSTTTGQNYLIKLVDVKYPHSTDFYTYESTKLKRNFNLTGYVEVKRVTERKTRNYDSVGGVKSTRDKVTYSYISDAFPLDPIEQTYVVARPNALDNYSYSSTKTTYNGSTAVLSETNDFQSAWNRKTSTTVTALSGPNAGEKQVTSYYYDPTLDWVSYYGIEDCVPIMGDKPIKVSVTPYSASNEAGETLSTLYTYDSVWHNIATETMPINVAQQSSPSKYTITYTYNSNIMVPAGKSWYKNINDSSALTETYSYGTDDGGKIRLLYSKDTLDQYIYYDYDYTDGRVSKITVTKPIESSKQAKVETTFTSATGYAYPATVTTYANNQSATTSSQYNMLWGQPSSTTEKNRTTTYTYDNIGRVTKANLQDIPSSDGICQVEQNLTYTPLSALTSTDTENNNTLTFMVETSTKYTVGGTPTNYNKVISYYNYNGNLLEERAYDSTGANPRISQYRYDLMGRAVYSKDPAGNTNTGSYDSFGEMRQVLDPSQNSYYTIKDRKNRTVTSYFIANGGSTQEFSTTANLDQWERPTSYASNGLTESFTYDLAGNVLTHTDPRNHTTTFGYDNAGQLKTVKDRLEKTTSYNYTVLGKLASFSQTDGTNTWTTYKYYDEMGRLISKVDPGNLTDSFTYDEYGLLDTATDPMETLFDTNYDTANRVSSKTAGATSYTYTYKGSPYGINTLAYNDGSTTRTASYNYNNFGQVQGITLNNHNVNYQYDAAGRVSAVGIDSSNWSLVKYNLDKLHKIQTNGSLTNSDTAADNAVFSYYPNGLLQTITYPTLTGGSVLTANYTYYTSGTSTGRLYTVTNKKDTTTLSSYTYTYDNNGNITGITDNAGNASAYEYDYLDRLNKITKNNVITQSYTYDVRGNRDTQIGAMPTMVADAATFSNDVWNQLTSATVGSTTTTFGYGPTGLRVQKGTKNYIYDANGNVIAEADASNNITATYIWGGNRLLVKKISGVHYYYLYNGHGDVVQIVDAAGNVVNSYTYDEWGNITLQVEGIANEFKYAGQIYDSETGLYYLRARYYDPTIGRFIQRDSYEGDISNPLSLNLYTYCYNQPIIRHDPSGHIAPLIAAVFCGASKAVDYGWTAWDVYKSNKVLDNPRSNRVDKFEARLNIALAAAFEITEPDDETPIGTPFDDLARHEVMDQIDQVLQQGGENALRPFLYKQLGPEMAEKVCNEAGVKVVALGRGSTGRTTAKNLNEQLAMKEVLSNPLEGASQLRITMTDKRWLSQDGWVKMTKNVNGTEVHFVYNPKIGAFDDFKFK